jgi:hypothetical protein
VTGVAVAARIWAKTGGRYVGANAMEVVVVGRRFSVFVHCWSGALCAIEIFPCLRVPDDTETVHIVEAVSRLNFSFCRITIGRMGDEFGQVVCIDLLGQSMCLPRVSEPVMEQDGMRLTNVPALSGCRADSLPE